MTILEFMAAPIVMSFLLVAIHSYLGLQVLEREVVFVDIGLSQVAALGAALSLWAGGGEEGGGLGWSLGLCLFAAAFLSWLRRVEKRVPQEALIGMTYAFASGALVLVADRLPHGIEHLKQSLVGNILFVTWREVGVTFLVYAGVGLVHWFFRNQFWRAAEKHGAGAEWRWDFLFYLLFGVVITFSTHHAGILVVFSILVAPAAFAVRVATARGARLAIAWGAGLTAVLIAFGISYVGDTPAGPTLVCVLTGLFFVSLALPRRFLI